VLQRLERVLVALVHLHEVSVLVDRGDELVEQPRPRPAQNIGMIVLFPLSVVSNALVATQRMPALLRAIADWNPVSAVTAAARQLFHNPNPSAAIHAGPMQHPVTAASLWSVALLAVLAPLAAWLYRRRTTE